MAGIQPASLILDGGDPRKPSFQAESIVDDAARLEHAKGRKICFEEYIYYAAITRAEEREARARLTEIQGPRGSIKDVIKAKLTRSAKQQGIRDEAITESPSDGVDPGEPKTQNEKVLVSMDGGGGASRYGVTPAERKMASRAIRTAGWGSIFFLITTDILGPLGAPWAFAQMGYGPGIALYTSFGILSYYSGWILWKVFLALDSDHFPLRGYGDFFFRMFGPWARHFINVAQSVQLLFTVSLLIISNGQSISQISRGSAGSSMGLCFVACLLIFMAAGMVTGQIRTLRRLGLFANVAVWLNIATILIVMASVGYGPNYAAVEATFGYPSGEPIQTFAGTPPAGQATGGVGFVASLNGLNIAVYAYGGAMLFAALLAEMRHPLDFWKSLIIAEIFIYACYIFFGIFMYSYQGQYSYNPAVQGVAQYGLQTAANILSIITGLIAAVLYSNIGLKVVYVEVFHELLRFPPLTTRTGKVWWAVLIPVYWAVAFVIGAAVPQFSYVTGLVGAFFILSFTYTFPAWLAIGFWIKKDAMVEGEESFDPATNTYNYVDHGWKRWRRGFMKKPLFNTWNIIYFLGSLATCALGCYSSIVSLREAFDNDIANSLSCKPPL
ncbi:transmembrane amino acid transporter protein-domain-containing protein [Xylariomycetidae sp. FL2044]|nr:transmembrane amino acid transporter protein-domain-containing protein [Xylariomycetidae sp. FL2044]